MGEETQGQDGAFNVVGDGIAIQKESPDFSGLFLYGDGKYSGAQAEACGTGEEEVKYSELNRAEAMQEAHERSQVR